MLERRASGERSGPADRGAKLQRVVVAVDGSPATQAALRWTASVIEPQSRVAVVHAVGRTGSLAMDSTGLSPKDWRRRLRHTIAEEWCAPLHGCGVRPAVHLLERGVVTAVLAVVEEEQADLLVVGAHRHDHLHHGQATLASHLVHASPCPVTCIPWLEQASPQLNAGL